MNYYYVEYLGRILGKLRLSKYVKPIFFMAHNQGESQIEFSESIARLNAFSPDSGKSAIRKTPVQVYEEYDLQIIVPAYNEENTIGKCIESILANRSKYKVLTTVINDGSTDMTGDILQKYNLFDNVEIISQENRGFSGSRNRGLSMLRARYVMFVDSDDTVPSDAIENLLDRAIVSQADIIFFGGGYCIVNQNDSIADNYTPITERQHGYPWGKIYRSYLFERVIFPEQYWFEDTVIGMIIDKLASRTSNIRKSVYNYLDNPDGITHKANGKRKVLDSLYVTLRLLKDRESIGLAMTKSFYDDLLYQIRMNQRRIGTLRNMKVNRDVFNVHKHLLSRYRAFKTVDKRLELLEWSLRHNNFSAYLIACI